MTAIDRASRERGGCLSVFLVVSMIVLPIAGLYPFFTSQANSLLSLFYPGWYLPVMALISLADFVFVVAIWKWKAWGVLGYGALSAIGFLINISVTGFVSGLFGLVSLVLLIILVRPVWGLMD